jgi:hypothetical protein
MGLQFPLQFPLDFRDKQTVGSGSLSVAGNANRKAKKAVGAGLLAIAGIILNLKAKVSIGAGTLASDQYPYFKYQTGSRVSLRGHRPESQLCL